MCGIQGGVGCAVTTITITSMQHCIAPSLPSGLLQVISVTHGSSFELWLERVTTDGSSGSSSPPCWPSVAHDTPWQQPHQPPGSPPSSPLKNSFKWAHSNGPCTSSEHSQHIDQSSVTPAWDKEKRTWHFGSQSDYAILQKWPYKLQSDHLRDKIPSKDPIGGLKIPVDLQTDCSGHKRVKSRPRRKHLGQMCLSPKIKPVKVFQDMRQNFSSIWILHQ